MQLRILTTLETAPILIRVLNACAQAQSGMAAPFTRVEAWYAEFSEEDDQVFQQFQAEWKDLALRECEFQSGAFLIDTGGILQYKGVRWRR